MRGERKSSRRAAPCLGVSARGKSHAELHLGSGLRPGVSQCWIGGLYPRASPGRVAIAAFIASPDSAALIPLGAELYEPTEFAYADDGAAEELSELIVRLKEPVLIRDMPADSIIVESLRRFGGRRLVTSPSGGRPWLELDDSWLEPESHLNSGRRSDLRRALRNAEKQGPVRCEITTPTQENPRSSVARCVSRGGGWLEGRSGFRRWQPIRNGSVLYKAGAGGLPARYSPHWNVAHWRSPRRHATCHRTGWLLMALQMGFDESFARFSPGTLLMVESLRSARQRGCNRYELMGKSEAWNRIWRRACMSPSV